MKTVILTNDSESQQALCNKLAEVSEVAAIVVSRKEPRRTKRWNKRLKIFAARLQGRLIGRPLVDAWQSLQERYQREFGRWPVARLERVANVNDRPVTRLIEEVQPDYVLVSGTRLLSSATVETIRETAEILNLHTGLSPYVKGGPNCTNWCLAEGDFHLIGNTVMWLDAGIDSGALIATERTGLTGRETLRDLHWKVMEHAHDLYVRVVDELAAGRKVPGIPQADVDEGETYYTVQWNGREMLKAQYNFAQHFNPSYFAAENLSQHCASVETFPLDERLAEPRPVRRSS